MFGWHLIHNRELSAYALRVSEYRKQIEDLILDVKHERERAERAINALLVKEKKIAINLDDKPMTFKEQDEVKARVLDIFNDGNTMSEEEALEMLQK